MRVNVYKVVQDCIERGVERGYRRAHKNEVTPAVESVTASIEQEVLNELCEYFVFDLPIQE